MSSKADIEIAVANVTKHEGRSKGLDSCEKLSNFLERYEIGMTVKSGPKPAWPSGQKHYRVTLNWATAQTFDYFCNGEPTLTDVLSCLVSECVARDNCRDVLDYIGEYVNVEELGAHEIRGGGRVRETWNNLTKNRAKVRKLLGSDYELVMQLENDI